MQRLMAILIVGLGLQPLAALAQQPECGGQWAGQMMHTSCLGSRASFHMVLSLEANQKGKLALYHPFQNPADSLATPLFAFAIRPQWNDGQLQVNYTAADEVNSQRFGLGYYIMGSYLMQLAQTNRNGIPMLEGLYRGSNGGRAIVSLRCQTQPQTAGNDNDLFARLRQQQQQRKLQQTGLPPGSRTTAPVTSEAASQPAWSINDSLTALHRAEQRSLQRLEQRTDSLHLQVALPDTLSWLELEMYDNADIDGDTISLFVNDVLVMHRQVLSAQPLVYRLHKPVQMRQATVRIVAENLGSIPPNTALVQWKVLGQYRRLTMKSDEKTNGSIIFQWQ